MRRYILLWSIVLLGVMASAQRNVPYSKVASPEKIYIQTDNEVYAINQTIWFKVVLVDALSHAPEVTSGLLYVDLISFEEEVVGSTIVKVQNGVGKGHFDLDRSYLQGVYQIRAYTEWNKNFSDDFVFKKNISIYSDVESVINSNPIQNIKRVDSSETKNMFTAHFFPNRIDSQHKKRLKAYINIDGKIDSLWLRSNTDKHVLEFSADKMSKQITIGFQTESGLEHYKTFSPNLDFLDIQFFPESGKLIEGLPSRVGFKAVDSQGKGIQVNGKVLNDRGELISVFKSNALGMGHFSILEVSASENYKAVITQKNNHEIHKEIKFPKVHQVGYTFFTLSTQNIITVHAHTNQDQKRNVHLKVASRGYDYFNFSKAFTNGKCIFSIAKNKLPEGIVNLTLLDENKLPVAERLYFNYRDDLRIDLNASFNKQQYSTRDKVNIRLGFTNMNEIDTSVHSSVLVLKKDRTKSNIDSKQNILSYLLLSSDLKGLIERPSAYFLPNSDLNIDDLMLTQGWRNYKYNTDVKKIRFKREQNLYISGVVNPKNSKLEAYPMELSLVCLDSMQPLQSKEVIAPSNFRFDLVDAYSYSGYINAVLEPSNVSQKDKRKISIAVKKKKPLPITYNFEERNIIYDSILQDIMQDNTRQKRMVDEYLEQTTGVIQLDEVILDGYKMTPKRREMFEKYGEPNVVIKGKHIKEKEKKWSYGLLSVLLFSFRDKIKVNMGPSGRISIKSYDAGRDPTFIVVDGIPVDRFNFNLIQYMSVDEITSVEIIDNAKNIPSLFQRVFPSARPSSWGSVIAIYTKAGKGLAGAIESKKIVKSIRIPVFSIEKEFYVPDYADDGTRLNMEPDLRPTIFWEPNLRTSIGDKSEVSFYHSDDEGEFVVIVESISDYGKIGYKEFSYTVRKSDTN